MIRKLSLILLLQLVIQETNSIVECETDEHCTKYPWGFKNRECIRGRCLCIKGTILDLDTGNCVKDTNQRQWWTTNIDTIEIPYAPVDKVEELEEEDTKSKWSKVFDTTNGTLSKPPWEWNWHWVQKDGYWGWRWPATFAAFALLIIVSHLWSYCKRRCKSPGEQEQPDVELSQPPEQTHTPTQPVNQLSPDSSAANANLDPPSYEESQKGLP